MVVLLQQNARFDMTLGEWIALGDVGSIESRQEREEGQKKEGEIEDEKLREERLEKQKERVRRAIEKSEASEIVDRLEGGLDCRLGPAEAWDTEETFLDEKIARGEKGDEDEDEDREEEEEGEEISEEGEEGRVDSGIATPIEVNDKNSEGGKNEKKDEIKSFEKPTPPTFSGGRC
jgi:hypothetical protein